MVEHDGFIGRRHDNVWRRCAPGRRRNVKDLTVFGGRIRRDSAASVGAMSPPLAAAQVCGSLSSSACLSCFWELPRADRLAGSALHSTGGAGAGTNLAGLPTTRAESLADAEAHVASPGTVGSQVRHPQILVPGTEAVKQEVLRYPELEAFRDVDSCSPRNAQYQSHRETSVKRLRNVLAKQETQELPSNMNLRSGPRPNGRTSRMPDSI